MKGWGTTSVSISKSSPKNSYTFPTSIKDKVFEGQIDIFLPWMNVDACQSFWVNHSRRRRSGWRGTNFWRGNIWKVWWRWIHMVPSCVHAWTNFEMRNVHSITDGLNMDTTKIEKYIFFSIYNPSQARRLFLFFWLNALFLKFAESSRPAGSGWPAIRGALAENFSCFQQLENKRVFKYITWLDFGFF